MQPEASYVLTEAEVGSIEAASFQDGYDHGVEDARARLSKFIAAARTMVNENMAYSQAFSNGAHSVLDMLGMELAAGEL